MELTKNEKIKILEKLKNEVEKPYWDNFLCNAIYRYIKNSDEIPEFFNAIKEERKKRQFNSCTETVSALWYGENTIDRINFLNYVINKIKTL